MPLTVGGGVRTIEDMRALLSSGADKVSINTAAVARRAFVKEAAEKFGDQCIVVAIDAKKVSQPQQENRWEIFTHGGRHPTGLDAIAYAREVVTLGAGEILLTSMDRDGTRQGFDIALTRAVADAVPVPVDDSPYAYAAPRMENLDKEEINQMGRLIMLSLIGFLVAAMFLSRAFVMTLFMLGGIAEVIFQMALDRGMIAPRLPFGRITVYSGILTLVMVPGMYLLVRILNMMH